MCYKEIQQVKNYSFTQVSDELTKMSIWLFWHYPGLYLQSASRAYFNFWYLPDFVPYWDLTKVKYEFLSRFFSIYIFIELRIWIFLNLIFIFFSIYNIIQFIKKSNVQNLKTILLLDLTILILSVLQALVQYGDNWRFELAVKPLIILTLVLNIVNLRSNKSKTRVKAA